MKDFVAAHGGHIEFVSGELSGTHIRVVLPFRPVEHGVPEGVENPYSVRPL